MHKLTISSVNLIDFKLNSNISQIIADSNQSMYFIPTASVELLTQQIQRNFELNNYTYIKQSLEIVSILARKTGVTVSSKEFQAHGNYKKILEQHKRIIVDKIIPYSVEDNKAYIYILKETSDWSFVLLTNDDPKEYWNYLPAGHICDNEFYQTAWRHATINTQAAIEANYNLTKEQDDPSERITLNQFASRVAKILRFVNNRTITLGKTGRVFSSFELDSTSRKYVTYNNKHFTEIDISNSQPLLLSVVLLQRGLKVDDAYIDLVSKGRLWQYLIDKAKELSYNTETIFEEDFGMVEYYFNNKSHIKKLMYRSIMFKCKSTKQSKMAELFSILFPKTYQSCIDLNKIESVAGLLQNIEANIVLNIVPQCPYFTLHDAIYVLDKRLIESVKYMLTKSINEFSNGIIKEVTFGTPKEPEFFQSTLIEQPLQEYQINNMRKPRSVSPNKLMRIEEFKSLYYTTPKHNILDIMNISEKTFIRYKKELIK